MTAGAIIRAGAALPCGSTVRRGLTAGQWRAMAAALDRAPELQFVGLWADPTQVHALFWCGEPVLVSGALDAGLFAALSPARPGAALFERAVADLWGHQAADAADTRPWLDHGCWRQLRPMAERPVPNGAEAPEPPEMAEVEGQAIGLGPLPPVPVAGAGVWRMGVEGGRVTGLEARLGFGHRGVVELMRGKVPAVAARLAGRISGGATVAHATAFARAVEAAAGVDVPPRARALRGAMLAIERVALCLHDAHAVADAFGLRHPDWLDAREALLAASGAALGHRLMLDGVRPGGVAVEPEAAGLALLDAALDAVPEVRAAWPEVGVLAVAEALALGVGGAVGRASGRQEPAHVPRPVLAAGDVAARMELRGLALEKDLVLARELLADLPSGPASVAVPHGTAEGLGVAAGPQGDVWHWVSLSGGLVVSSFAVDPGWLQLPALEAAAVGARAEWLNGIAASFGLHPAGMEL